MSRSSTRLAYKTTDIELPSTTLDSPALRSSKRIRASSIASSAVSASTPRKRGRPSLAGPEAPAGTESEGQVDSSKRGRRDDLWDDELDTALFRGLKLLPKMGRRTIYLEDDDESYGRNGLLGEYLRRQTGRIRNRTQVASHLAVMRKNNPDDQHLADLSVGHDISPEQFNSTHWSTLLGPDLHPATRAAAKAENDKVKRHREGVVIAQKARRGSSVGGSSPAPRRPRRARHHQDSEGESNTESDLTDLDSEDPPAAPPSSTRRHPRSTAAAPTSSTAFHSHASASAAGTPARRSARRSLAPRAGSSASPAPAPAPTGSTQSKATPQRRAARAVAVEVARASDAEEDNDDEAAGGHAAAAGDAMDVEPAAAPAEVVARVAASASASASAAPGAGQVPDVDVDVDSEVREGEGAGWLSGVRKGLWRLVGY